MPNKKTYLLIFSVIIFLVFFKVAGAQMADYQDPSIVDYAGQPVVDTDLDALTDEGEKQLYKTDPNKTDTDDDKYDDGVEVLAGTDPLNAGSFPGAPVQVAQSQVPAEIPWAWYFSRSSALVSFALLWLAIFLGISIRMPVLSKIIKPVYAYGSHCWISLLALLFALFHGTALMFDKTINFSLFDVFVPFAAGYKTTLVALGTLAWYLILLLVITSYVKKFVSQKMWRLVHAANIILYAIGIIHALYLGTDLQGGLARDIFIYANAFLIFLFLANIEVRLAAYFKNKYSPAE